MLWNVRRIRRLTEICLTRTARLLFIPTTAPDKHIVPYLTHIALYCEKYPLLDSGRTTTNTVACFAFCRLSILLISTTAPDELSLPSLLRTCMTSCQRLTNFHLFRVYRRITLGLCALLPVRKMNASVPDLHLHANASHPPSYLTGFHDAGILQGRIILPSWRQRRHYNGD